MGTVATALVLSGVYGFLACLTMIGSHRRGNAAIQCVAEGLAWPMSWVWRFVTDNHAAGRRTFQGRRVAVRNLRACHQRPRDVRTLPGIWATSISVVLLVSCVAGCTSHSAAGRGVGASASSAASDVTGSQWRPIALRDATGNASLTDTRCTANIGFTRDGYALGYDTVNPIQSRYRLTPPGYTAGTPAIGGVGFIGHDRLRLRLIAAIDSMFEGAIIAKVKEDRLVLTSATATLVLHRDGTQSDLGSGPRTNPHLKPGC